MSTKSSSVSESTKTRSTLVGLSATSLLVALVTLYSAPPAYGQTSADTGSTRSQDCKEAAANKWLLDYIMEHGNPSYEQTLEVIRQVSVFSKAIRIFCGDNRINNEILQSAKQGTPPLWIDSEISKLLAQLAR